MRLLLVSDTFTPDINGVARTLRTLGEALAERGHEVRVVTTLEGTPEDVLDRVVVPSVPLPGYAGLRIGFTTWRFMDGIIEAFGPDVIYVATETPLGISTIRAAARHEVPVVSGFHTNFHTYLEEYHLPGLETVAQAFLRNIHNQTAKTLTPSTDMAEELRSWGIDNVGILGRGVQTDVFHPAKRDADLRNEWGAADDVPVAVYVGRIAAEKNLPLVVKAFEAIRVAHPGAPCVFVGDGPKLRWLQAEFPDFHYAGARTGEDLARHYASADLFVFPSLTETYGNVVAEAMSSGLGTVAFDYAAPRLLIDHQSNGWLAPFGDESAFLEACSEAAKGWDDKRLRAAAREAVLPHSWDAVVEHFENELEDARHGAMMIPASSAASVHE